MARCEGGVFAVHGLPFCDPDSPDGLRLYARLAGRAPWSVANWPGLCVEHGGTDGRVYCLGVSGLWGRYPVTMSRWQAESAAHERIWLTSTRLPEPLSPGARALVQRERLRSRNLSWHRLHGDPLEGAK